MSDKVSRKIKKYVESKIVIEPRDKPPYWLWRDKPLDEQAKRELEWYRGWAEELKEFLRDHRSQDINDVYADVIEIDACSVCGEEWEIDKDEHGWYCAYCGVLIEDQQIVKESK